MPTEVKWGLSLVVGGGLVWLGWKFTPLLVGLHILVSFVLVFVIMLQSGSAADLAGAFGGAGSQTAFGPRGAATFLSRATTWCAIMFMVTSVSLSVKRTPTAEAGGGSSVLEQTQKAPASSPARPLVPAPTRTPSQQTPVPTQPSPAPSQNQAPAQNPAKPPAPQN